MLRLNTFSTLWRDYFFANSDGKYNDVNDFLLRVQLISDSHYQIVETMVSPDPNMDLVKECVDEIAFQRVQLEDLIKEFIDYYYDNNSEYEEITVDALLDDLCKNGTTDALYRIVEEWKEWGTKSSKIWEKLNKKCDYKLHFLKDDLCKLILQEVYGHE